MDWRLHEGEFNTRGWSRLAVDESISLVEVASGIGVPCPSRRDGPLVDHLRPLLREAARPNSMSARHGLGRFPFHTDSANFRVPPRYCLLRLARGSSSHRATLLVDVSTLPLDREGWAALRAGVWYTSGGRGRFLSSILSSSLVPGHEVLRFDRCCMRPAHPRADFAARTLESACARVVPTRIDWSTAFALVVDNWRILHARDVPIEPGAEDRVLERVLVRAEASKTS